MCIRLSSTFLLLTAFVGVLGVFEKDPSSVHAIPALHRYGTLRTEDLKHSITKAHESSLHHQRHIKFQVLGRKFHIRLRVNHGLFSNDFVARTINHLGASEYKKVDMARFYHGILEDDRDKSHVSAHVDHDGHLTATIHASHGVYSVEPSWRHVRTPHDFHMIAYRDEDIKPFEAPFCGVNHSEPHDHDHHHAASSNNNNVDTERLEFGHLLSNDEKEKVHHRRMRRQAVISGTVCPVTLVADHRFYTDMGSNDFAVTATTMIGQLNQADGIFRTTTWRSNAGDITAFGLQVREIIVHMTSNSSTTHYNSATRKNVRDLLGAFSFGNWDSSRTCLAHLFTSQGFDNNVLGLAYVASPDRNAIGGICTRVYQQTRWLNVGLSTSMNCRTANSGCRTLITREFELVTAHELGHSWGSQHDISAACVRTESGGRFLMNTFALPGTEPNNNIFSSCSQASIGAVLQQKGVAPCFVARKESICGNGLKEETEDCDPGLRQDDPCCHSRGTAMECQFKESRFQCSDSNDVCCLNCLYRNQGHRCRMESTDSDISCLQAAFCNGNSSSCPRTYKTSGRCGDNGQCAEPANPNDARCRSPCESLGMTACLCSGADQTLECYVCCRPTTGSGGCTPGIFNGSRIRIQDGKPCVEGFCYSGTCQRSIQDANEKLWNIFTSISADDVARWFRDNIVAAVLVCTFLAWVFGGLIVRYFDKKRMANFNEEFDNYIRRWKEARKEPAMRSIEKKASSLRRKPFMAQEPVTEDDGYIASSVTVPLTYTEVGRDELD